MNFKTHVIYTIIALSGLLAILLIVADYYFIQGSFLDITNNKYNIAATLHMSPEDVSRAAHSMIDYVRGDIEDAQILVSVDGETTNFFTEKELLHLVDVRALVKSFMTFKIVCLVVFMIGLGICIWRKELKALCVGVWIAWGLLLILSVAVGIMAYIDVDLVINGFHEIFFDNDLWILSYRQHRSLYMFQDCMYIDFLLSIAKVLGIILFGSVAVSIGGYVHFNLQSPRSQATHRTP